MIINKIKKYSNLVLFISALIVLNTVLSFKLTTPLIIVVSATAVAALLAYLSLKQTKKEPNNDSQSTQQSEGKIILDKKDILIIDSLKNIKNHLSKLTTFLDSQSQQNKKSPNNFMMNDMIMDSLLIMSINGSNAYIIEESSDNPIHKYQESVKVKKLQHFFKRKGQHLNILRAKDPKFQASQQEGDYSKENLALDFPGNLINFN
jgi:hypothetical protein